MNFEERVAKQQAKLAELKARLNESMDVAREAYQYNKNEREEKLNEINAKVEDFNKEVERKVTNSIADAKSDARVTAQLVKDDIADMEDRIDDKIEAKADKIGETFDRIDARTEANRFEREAIHDEAVEMLQARADDQRATVEGNVSAVEENFRLAKERYNSKLNNSRLKVQMHQEELKRRIDNTKTELDMAAEEQLINDLLDYADDCELMAYAYAVEAEMAVLDACDVLTDYTEKLNKLIENN